MADCMKFISTDYEDDQDTKMALMQIIADPRILCHLCNPPKEWHLCKFVVLGVVNLLVPFWVVDSNVKPTLF